MWIRKRDWDELVRKVEKLWRAAKKVKPEAEPTFKRGDVVEMEGQYYRFHLICGPQDEEGRWKLVGSDGLYWWACEGLGMRLVRPDKEE